MKRLTLPRYVIPTQEILFELYFQKKFSVAQIAQRYNCSQNKINYWLLKYGFQKRTISDAIYHLKNPLGDPFVLKQPQTLEEGILFGMGLGLYWGEGTKRGSGGMRITNSDPKMIRKFVEFLEKFLNIKRERLRVSIQIFGDLSPQKSLDYWVNELNIRKEQFYIPRVIKVRGEGTYKYKSKYGTIILQFNNTRLKKTICDLIENIQ